MDKCEEDIQKAKLHGAESFDELLEWIFGKDEEESTGDTNE